MASKGSSGTASKKPPREKELPLLRTLRSRKFLRRASRILEIVMYLHEIPPSVVSEALGIPTGKLTRDMGSGQVSLRQMHCILELAGIKPHAFINAVLKLGLPGMQPKEEPSEESQLGPGSRRKSDRNNR